MPNLKLYTTFDKVAKHHNMPFASRTHEEVIRGLRGAVNNAERGNVLYEHPKDYAVYCIGEFNEETGEIIPNERALVAECATLVIPKES